MKIAINPSTQFHNPYCCSNDVEGYVMGTLGNILIDVLNRYGAPSIQARLFWNGPEGGDNYAGQVAAATAWDADLLVSFHTDSAGDKRGYTGSLLCYSKYDDTGRALGWAMMNQMKNDFNWPISGESERSGTLCVLDSFANPSCLLEVGNHSDPDDCRFMLDNLGKFAESIAWGIFAHAGINPKRPRAIIKQPEVDMSVYWPVPYKVSDNLWSVPWMDGGLASFWVHVNVPSTGKAVTATLKRVGVGNKTITVQPGTTGQFKIEPTYMGAGEVLLDNPAFVGISYLYPRK